MFIDLNKSFYIQNPCKKCIVRACCKNECEKLIDFRLCFYPFNNRAGAIIMTTSIYISMSAFIVSLIKIWFIAP